MNIAPFVEFIRERESVRVKKERGDPWPWTDDPVLSAYRFCNIRREDDKETRLIHRNWLAPHASDPDLWFACAVARLVNWWPSLERVGYPVPWGRRKRQFISVLAARHAAGEKQFTGAYMIRADPHVSGLKSTYIAEMVLSPMWEARALIRPKAGDTLSAFHARLLQYKDMGSFLAGQIVADAKFFDAHLKRSEDWWFWAAPGPGSQRGLNCVLGRAPDFPWKGKEWETAFAELLRRVTPVLGPGLRLDGQNLQNCLCEFSKKERGYSRSKYTVQ